jgi:hypothetical protein
VGSDRGNLNRKKNSGVRHIELIEFENQSEEKESDERTSCKKKKKKKKKNHVRKGNWYKF